MTSVCQIKSRMPHDVLMTKTLSSLSSSFADEDSSSEKAPDIDKVILEESEKQSSDKNNADSSEFSIANILGFQGKKPANAQFGRPSNFSKWRLRDASPIDDDEELNCNKVSHHPFQNSIKHETRCSPPHHERASLSRNQIKTEGLEGKQNQHKTQTCVKNEGNTTTVKDANETGADKSSQNNTEMDSKGINSCREEQTPSAWASALSSYYESLNPTWRLWQDLLIRRSFPVAPSSRQQPSFHPYMRRLPGLLNPPHSFYGNMAPFPVKSDALKSKNTFSSQGMHPEDLGKTSEGK